MDTVGEEQVLQANLGRYNLDGIDNGALDVDLSQLEDFLNNDNDSFNFPDDAVSVSSYGNDGGGGGGMDPGGLKQMSMPGHTHGPGHVMQTTAPQLMCGIPDTQVVLSQMQKNPSYCPQLPDSPPDSSSEPYSPPDGNHPDPNVKSSIVSSMASVPHEMYSNPPLPHGHPHHSSMSPPSHNSPPSSQAMPVPPKPQHTVYSNGEPPKLNHPPSTPHMPPQTQGGLPPMPPEYMQSQYPGMDNLANQANKKRKFSESPNNTVTPGVMNNLGLNMNGMMNIKQEPNEYGGFPDCGEDDFSNYDLGSESGMFMDGTYQVIKWQAFQPTKWAVLLDYNYKELPAPSYRVDADKGFNFSIPDDTFVCQKKNHFQITTHVGIAGDPKYVKTPEGTKKIESFHLHFNGIKMESTSQTIKIEQSQSNRSRKPFYPVKVDLPPDQVTKVTVGRLHFSETTSNNMRKKGKPNPDQRYFMLVVALHAHSGSNSYIVAAHVSEKIIVRASNPGQFDSDVDVLWQKGHTPDSVIHAGRVGINTDRPDESLTIHGNVRVTGHIVQPSDKRAKVGIEEIDPKEQLKNVQALKVYRYEYNDAFAEHAGLSDDEKLDTGVLAQEVVEVLPDAVRETGDVMLPNGQTIENFLVVNKDRIYMENVGAVKELCKLTDNLENRIDELEKMNKKLTKIKRFDSLKSTASTKSVSSCGTINRNDSLPIKSKKSQTHTKSHHHHRQTPPEEEHGLCTNKFIQITVIVLVLVMAFCLVSITILYILEKQKPGEERPSDISIQGTRPPQNITGDHNYTIPIITNSPSPGTNPDTNPLPEPPGYVAPLTPPRCEREHCPTHCCPPRMDDPRWPSPKTVKPSNNNEENSLDANKTVVYSLADHFNKNRTPNQPANSNVNGVPGGQVPTVRPANGNDPVVSMEDNTMNDYLLQDPKILQLQLNNPAQGFSSLSRQKRASPTSDSDVLRRATITIPEANKTVDLSMCSDERCRTGMGGNFSYSIPISQYFPTAYLTVDFLLAPGLSVMLCQEPKGQMCSGPHDDDYTDPDDYGLNAMRADINEWHLPVGYFFVSTYDFRVAPTSMMSEICQASSSDVGHTYNVYSLYFYRVCEDDIYA